MSAFVPDSGDLVWLDFDPQAGHVQAGRRPALVLSPKAYNQRTGLSLACPVTSRIKGYPFEVLLPEASKVRGVVLVDQVRSLDWRARNAGRIGRVTGETLDEVLARLAPLLGYRNSDSG